MKQFFKFMFASMLGFIISGVVLFFILIGAIAGLASKGDKEEVKSRNKLYFKTRLKLCYS